MIGILNLLDIKKINKEFNINITSISGEAEDISFEFTKKIAVLQKYLVKSHSTYHMQSIISPKN